MNISKIINKMEQFFLLIIGAVTGSILSTAMYHYYTIWQNYLKKKKYSSIELHEKIMNLKKECNLLLLHLEELES
jgi:hypothetical protein